MSVSNNEIHGARVEAYLGIWCVDEILEGSQGICGDWATIGRHLALYQRRDGVVLGFTEHGFCLESYEPFWFKQCRKTLLLQGIGRDGVVKISVGFTDPGNKQIAFRFSHANGDSYTQDGGWDGHEMGG